VSRVSRLLLTAVFAVTAGSAVGGCSQRSGPSFPASVSGAPLGVTISHVRCVTQAQNVVVTGAATGETGLALDGIEAFVDDSVGRLIGTSSPTFYATGVGYHNLPLRFQLDVPVQGTPASCDVTWVTPSVSYAR
jgi:hypothetical protein